MNTDKIYAESIAKEYAPKDNSKIVALKKLDNKAKMPATIFTYTFGIISSLFLGTGMCFAMAVSRQIRNTRIKRSRARYITRIKARRWR